jgi:acyl-homoserine lactone acylase PvdQ
MTIEEPLGCSLAASSRLGFLGFRHRCAKPAKILLNERQRTVKYVIICAMPMLRHIRLILGLAVVTLLCLSHAAAKQQGGSRDDSLARDVTIYRDTYGVPHVFGRTDASTVFGFAYAQAEDNFWRVEENFINALGRASELYGEKMLDEDRLNHTLEIPRLAQAEYERLDKHTRSLCDAFASGFNYYLARHTEVKPRLLTKIEPWYTLAFIRYNYYQNGFARDRSLRGAPPQTAALETDLK